VIGAWHAGFYTGFFVRGGGGMPSDPPSMGMLTHAMISR
jgi:hypothetical protein